jgi:hypothetical protein
MSSLSSTFLRLRILAALKQTHHPSLDKINETTIYSYPTVDALAALISGGAHASVTMDELIQKYSAALDQPIRFSAPLSERQVVLLTGSTGNLGAELLLRLLLDPSVEKVFALNRPNAFMGSRQRHEERFMDRGFKTSILSNPKLEYLEGDTSKPLLGLSQDVYDMVWRPLPSFTPS